MNTNTRRKPGYVNAPQYELPIDGGFALMREDAEDGARITREREEREAREQAAKAAQLSFL